MPLPLCHNCFVAHAGLFLCQLGLDYAAPAQRFMPEVLTFANTLLSSALPSSQPRHQLHHLPEPLRLGSLNGWSTAVQQAGVGRLRLSQCEHTEQQQAAASSEFKAAALLAAVRVLERAARECDESAGVPEALEPSLQLLLKLEQQACLPLVRWQYSWWQEVVCPPIRCLPNACCPLQSAPDTALQVIPKSHT